MNMESDAGGSAAMFSCVWDGGVWVWMEGSNLHGIDVQHTAVPAEQHGCKLSSLYYWAAVGAALSAAHPLSRVNVEKLKAAKSWYSCTFMEICILFSQKCQKRNLSHLSLWTAEGHPVCHIYFVSPDFGRACSILAAQEAESLLN